VRPLGIAPRQGLKKNGRSQGCNRCVVDAGEPRFDSQTGYRNTAAVFRRRERLTGRSSYKMASGRKQIIGNPRVGTNHTYTLNGTLMRDVLVEGQWITVSTGEPLKTRAA
jgi:hypothetical protein